MTGERTVVTELATALGMLGEVSPAAAINNRSPTVRLTEAQWDILEHLHSENQFTTDFAAGFANGQAFLAARDGLRDRSPLTIEWTGGRRPPGDEVAPIDLRIDHVYLVSCKYLSRVIANSSPARIFDGLLRTERTWDTTHWYELIAPDEYQQLYEACREALELNDVPADVTALAPRHREALTAALPRGTPYPESARGPYAALCRTVSQATAQRWSRNIGRRHGEALLWRLLRIGNAPYFVLGASTAGSTRLRVASPWDWRQRYEFGGLVIADAGAGQPQVTWAARYFDRQLEQTRDVHGHVEIRWSHGRFSGNPEAKVYLDTPFAEIPGYFPLM